MNRLRPLLEAPHVHALACFVLIAAALAGPALLGRASLAPDTLLDNDPLYATIAPPPLPRVDDFTPIALDLPRDMAFARGLAAGRLDQWNPLAGCGAPLWAEQGGPFFPLKLPFYLAPSRRTYDLFLTLRLVLAAVGAYLLARRRGLPPTAAIAAGAMFEASGVLAAQLAFGSFSPTFVLPWVLLGSDAIARNPSPRAAGGAALALGLAASGGHPTLILLVFVAYAIALGAHMAAAWQRPRAAWSMATWGVLGIVVGLALAAPSWIPLADLAQFAVSYKDRPMGELVWSGALQRSRNALPIALFAPAMLELVRDSIGWVHAFAPVVGVLGLVLAVTGTFCGGLDAGLAGMAVLGVGLAAAPPGLAWLHQIPGLRLVLPPYAWSLVVLPLTQAAGTGVVVIRTARGRRFAAIAVALVCAGLLSLMFVSDAGPLYPFGTSLRSALHQETGIIRLVLPPVVAMLVVLACGVVARSRLAGWCGIGIALVAVLEELSIVVPLARQRPSSILSGPPPPAVQKLREYIHGDWGRILAIPATIGFPLTPMLFDLPDVRGVAALPLRRFQLFREAIQPGPLDTTVQDIPVTRSPLVDLAAVDYVIVPRGTPSLKLNGDAQMPLIYGDHRVLIYQNRAALPRVRIVHRATSVPNAMAAQEWLQDVGRGAAHARACGLNDFVAVEPDADGHDPPEPSGTRSPYEVVQVTDQTDPDMLRLTARLDSPGFVVIADTYHPSWRAWVDSTPAPVFPSDVLFRAVFVPSGEHDIVLRYEPASFRYGVGLFVLGCLVCAAVLLTT